MIHEIHNAVKAIASRCDGAVADDGVGFNGTDARFGHSLASRGTLTANQARAAYRMLRKYRGQLDDCGIDYDDLEPPEKTETTYGSNRRADYVDGEIRFAFDYDYQIKESVKRIPGSKWNKTKRFWSAPVTLESLEMVASLSDVCGFHMDAKLSALLDRAVQKSNALYDLSSSQNCGVTFDDRLFLFQNVGVEYAIETKTCFIADEMGLGKTVQALITARETDSYPLLVVCPAVVKLNWAKECATWTPDPSVSVIYGRNGIDFDGSDIYIINYDILESNKEWLMDIEWRMIVFDESHYLKNSKAKRTKAARAVAKDCERILMLSGTPILNKPIELVSQLRVMDRLTEFGGFKNFTQRYCNARLITLGREDDPTAKRFWDYDGSSNLVELNERLRSHCMVRRKKMDVLKDLPEKRIVEIYVDIDNRSEYTEAENELIRWIGEQAVADAQFLASIEDLPAGDQLREIARERGSAESRARRAEALVRIEKLKQLSAAGKIVQCCDWISDFLDTGEKLVVFATHRDVVEKIAHTFEAPFITGDTDVGERQRSIDLFQNDPKCNVIIANIKAGGVGITLTAASNVLFIEQGWTPSEHAQAEDRCHRIGQENSVTCYYMLGDHTIDCTIHKLIENKRDIIDATMDGESQSVLVDVLRSYKDG